MNKVELISEVARKTGLTKKDANSAVNALIESVEEALVRAERVQIIGFGTFETRARKKRMGRNPRRPDEVVEIAASRAPVFKAGKNLKELVNRSI